MNAAQVAVLLYQIVSKGNVEFVAALLVLNDAIALLPVVDQHDGGLTIYNDGGELKLST